VRIRATNQQIPCLGGGKRRENKIILNVVGVRAVRFIIHSKVSREKRKGK
jgi:hypothetical protein